MVFFTKNHRLSYHLNMSRKVFIFYSESFDSVSHEQTRHILNVSSLVGVMFWLMVLITTVEFSIADISYEQCSREVTRGTDFRGDVDITESGLDCMSWTVGSSINPTMFPDAGLADGDGNLCRNPNDNLSGPWCFVSLSD